MSDVTLEEAERDLKITRGDCEYLSQIVDALRKLAAVRDGEDRSDYAKAIWKYENSLDHARRLCGLIEQKIIALQLGKLGGAQ